MVCRVSVNGGGAAIKADDPKIEDSRSHGHRAVRRGYDGRLDLPGNGQVQQIQGLGRSSRQVDARQRFIMW
jgi:hypothetical protein